MSVQIPKSMYNNMILSQNEISFLTFHLLNSTLCPSTKGAGFDAGAVRAEQDTVHMGSSFGGASKMPLWDTLYNLNQTSVIIN